MCQKKSTISVVLAEEGDGSGERESTQNVEGWQKGESRLHHTYFSKRDTAPTNANQQGQGEAKEQSRQ
jgi:hypothetical protein